MTEEMGDDNGKPRLTPKQRDLLEVLSDGECHVFDEILRRLSLLDEEQSTMFVHVSSLRKMLRPLGQTIVLENGSSGPKGYRWVVLVTRERLATFSGA